MLFLVDRRRRAGRYLEWKVGLFSIAAVLALVGISLEERWMTGGAIVLLVGAVLLRFLPGARHEEGEEEGHGEDGEAHEQGGEAVEEGGTADDGEATRPEQADETDDA